MPNLPPTLPEPPTYTALALQFKAELGKAGGASPVTIRELQLQAVELVGDGAEPESIYLARLMSELLEWRACPAPERRPIK